MASAAGAAGGRVAVIGAGVSGLAAARWLLAEGLQPIVFEAAATLGGIWNYDPAAPDGGGPAYRSLHTNTSCEAMAFSDLPFPAGLPEFPARADMLAYLHAYAERFGLPARIRFHTHVDRVAPAAGGGWDVAATGPEGPVRVHVGAVVVASGRDRLPVEPDVPGGATFGGTILHTSRYTVPEPFAGQAVVIVGLGSSGAEIAVELSRVARTVVLSTERGGWIVPRYIGGRPYDHWLTHAGRHLPSSVRARLFERLIRGEYPRLGLGKGRGQPGIPAPPFDLRRARLTANSDLLPCVARGAITVRPGLAALEPGTAVFTDGSRAPADAILFGTGYDLAFPFLADLGLAAPGHNVALYRHVFPPDHPGLAFVGLPIVAGPLPPVAELQARWVARGFAGSAALPPPAAMRRAIAADPAHATPYPMRVQLPDYLDDLAAAIGARPRPLRHLRLLGPLLFGPVTALHYRLDGPGRLRTAPALIRATAHPRHPGG